jgi:hypothetical protein
MAWTQNRETLWNAMEHAGLRRNSRVGREWLVFLPPELKPEQRSRLVRTFATELADKYRAALDCTIHQPRPGADPRNFHAHLLMTTREVSPDGIGARTTLELVGRERHLRGLGSSRDEYLGIRERWAQVTNEALQEAGLAIRVDHRSFKSQGIDREPTPTIPEKVFYAERKHGPSAAGDAIRARHRERVEARLKGGAELARVVERQKREIKARALEDLKRRDAQPKKTPWSALTRSERNELRRQQYEARRVIERQDPEHEARRREVGRQRYHATRAQNPDADRERRRQWRSEHLDEINRKQREYRKTHAEEVNSKRREYRRIHADDVNRKQQEYRRAAIQQTPSKPSPPTALDSARKWREQRQRQGPRPTPEESAQRWKALRESRKLPEPPQSSPAPARDQGVDRAPANADDAGHKPRPTHDHDLEL